MAGRAKGRGMVVAVEDKGMGLFMGRGGIESAGNWVDSGWIPLGLGMGSG